MTNSEQNQVFLNSSIDYLNEQISLLKSMLSYALSLPLDDIKISFPTLKNFYIINGVHKSSWAIYIQKERLPKLLFTGNFLVQGGNYGNRSPKSPFGAKALLPLTSLANTFSGEASFYKQNWAMDLNLFEDDSEKLKFSVKEYQEFLKLLNNVRAQWLLHLSEEGNFDFVISEFSEPSDPLFFMDLESFDSSATKIKTYFKPISEKALTLFQKLAVNTEFEGKFYSLQPGTWLRDDVLIEMEKFHSARFFDSSKDTENIIQSTIASSDTGYGNPFRVQALKPTF